MDSVILCYASEDEQFARNLAAFLEQNLAIVISCSEAVVRPGLDLIDATERALSAEAALVLLSPRSVPKVWDRKRWEPVLVDKPREFQTHLGFVLLENCRFPEILRRGRFFDASSDSLAAAREIKRWLLRPMMPIRIQAPPEEELEEIRKAAADRPGLLTDVSLDRALKLASRCAEDFESVYRLDLRNRSRAGMVGDLRHAAGSPCSGRTSDDDSAWDEWCTSHRALFVLAGVKAEDCESIAPGGRVSVIFTSVDDILPGSVQSPAAEAVRLFSEALLTDSRTAIGFGWAAVKLLKNQSRLEEVSEVLESMSRIAKVDGDTNALQQIEREQYWTRVYQGDESASLFESPDFAGAEQQMRFDFQAA